MPMALVMVTLVSLTVLLARRPVGDSWSDTWLAFGAALVLLPAVFPWYFVWLVPGLLICGFQAPGAPVSGVHISEYLRRPPRWLLVWICVVPMLHVVDWQHRVTGEWQPMRGLCIIVGIVPVTLLVMAWWRRLAARCKT